MSKALEETLDKFGRDENGFYPIVLGTLRNFLPDWCSQDDDAGIVELYERKVAQKAEHDYRIRLDRQYLRSNVETGKRIAEERFWDAVKDKPFRFHLEESPYGNSLLMFLIRNERLADSMAYLYDLDGYSEAPPQKKKLEVISLLREMRSDLTLALAGVPQYLIQASRCENGEKASSRYIFAAHVPAALGKHLSLQRIVPGSQVEMTDSDVADWLEDYHDEDGISELVVNTMKEVVKEVRQAESEADMMRAYASGAGLPANSPYAVMLDAPDEDGGETGDLERLSSVIAPDIVDKEHSRVLERILMSLRMISSAEPLESLPVGQLEYMAYSLGGEEDKAAGILEASGNGLPEGW